MTQVPISRIENYVKEYNEARKANNTPRAIEMGKLAVRDAADELKKDNLIDSHRNYYRTVCDEIGAFIANPNPPKPAKASGTGTEEKIKATDWFGAPVPDLTLNDIAGLKEVRDQFVLNVFAATDTKYSGIYRKYRGDDRGLQVLLWGPPGTGKTHVVRCLAGAMKCKLCVLMIKDAMANLVGDGAKIIAEVFEQASKLDRCIIFIDEIDALCVSREASESAHSKEQLTQLLVNMDGFTKAKPGQVRIVIAATNRPWALDSAILRGGRFDTQIYVSLPDAPAREQLVRLALGKDPKVKNRVDIPCAPDVTVEWLASRFKGYSGADIKSICRQAASLPMKREILAFGNGKPHNDMLTRDDFETVFARYITSTTDEDLMRFDAYGLNMNLDNKYIEFKLNQIILDLYNDEEIEGFEARMLRDAMETQSFKDKFGSMYDLSFIPAKLSAQGY